MLLSEGQMSDSKGAALMAPALPKAKELLADKGYDADWFRAALAKRGIVVCIPSKSNRKVAIPYDALLYK
jgi:transposase